MAWFWKKDKGKAELGKADFLLLRLEYGINETIGVLLYNGRVCSLSLELGWYDNKPSQSCIPQGRYRVRKNERNIWEVQDVPGRSAIQFHVGNSHYDTEGCICLGHEIGWGVGKTRMILASRNAMESFDNHLIGRREFDLEIVNGVYQTRPHGLREGVAYG